MSISMRERVRTGSATFLVSLLLAAGSAYASVDIDQQPLLVAKPVPGNMAIIGSFEFPTMVSKANNGVIEKNRDDTYELTKSYVGYFDSGKCYSYVYGSGATRAARYSNSYFEPENSNGPSCANNLWSGHFLNWSTMQSIDIFRSVLTGGYRSVDSEAVTILEKGVQTGQGGANNFPDGYVTDDSDIRNATPTQWSQFNTRILHLGNRMRFTDQTTKSGSWTGTNNIIEYDPSKHKTNESPGFESGKVYELVVRVRVCAPSMIEPNCVKYGSNYKPEGLIQNNSKNMRYSAFGYLNDNSSPNPNRDGGIMHARMKYVGPNKVTDENAEAPNPNKEWSETTGQFISNPDPIDASATTSRYGIDPIVHSGVISYINNSGQIVPGTVFKRYDNVSELFYAAYRYLKGLPNRPEYIAIGQSDKTEVKKLVGGLPVIDWDSTEADDPMQFSCQKNFFLGIGDTNTHPDTRVPKSDDTAEIAARVSRIDTLEGGLEITGGRSALIAGLAFDANTVDLRPSMPGKQTASTYWIDILEYGDLKARKKNQYWQAAKYGGLKTPDDFDPATSAIEESWWYTNNQVLKTHSDKRPDNFYVVDKAQDLVTGLVQAFADIQTEQTGNRSSLALNSTTLEAGSATFQAGYTSGIWTGDLTAFTVDATTGVLSSTAAWSASAKLPAPADRVIKTYNGSSLVSFTGATLNNSTLAAALKNTAADNSIQIIDYLRGDRSLENDTSGFRVRQSALGDVVNSQPVFIGNPNPRLYRGQTFNGSSSYASWAGGLSRTPVVYVGSNDGMLHGFNATTGQAGSGVETFAYVPKTVIENGLGELASPAYDHRYFVDGEMTVADAYDGSNWRTILIGTLGAGGVAKNRTTTNNAIFALDVTDPGDVKFLWEKNSTAISKLGNNLGKPVIAQIANGDWSVLLGNGPNSTGGKAQLISVDLFSGTVKSTEMSADIDNGLSAVRAWDSDGDGITDTVYAGDLQGNLWKVTGLVNNSWTVAKLFRALDASNTPQPITSSPLAGRSPYSQEIWLFVGTGQYLNTGDLTNTSVQTWYGINDDGSTTTASRANLLERKILLDKDVDVDADGVADISARVIEAGAREDLAGKRGWYIDLYQVAANGTRSALGERMVTPNQFQGSALIGNTRIPDASDPCNPTGRGVIMSIDPFTGARLVETYFDINADRSFSTLDMVKIDGVDTVVSGVGLNTGFSNPSFLDQKMYIPTDDGSIRDLEINPFTTGAGRTSWRELINTGN